MSGNKTSLSVFYGHSVIATLSIDEDVLEWRYDTGWQTEGFAISPHLPLQGDISRINIERYLRNLFPEGEGLEMVLAWFRLNRSNTFGIVAALGEDVTGGFVMVAKGSKPSSKAIFRTLPLEELNQRLDIRRQQGIVVWDNKPRLSVAGIQDKINVLLNKDGELGFGDGSLCSTHLLKFEPEHASHLALNEFVTMQLASQCGLAVADSRLLRLPNHTALLVKRFDRLLVDNKTVKRRHIIDACQALNLPPEYKYERNFGSGRDVAHIRDGASLNKLFEFAEHCINPASTKMQLLDWTIFNCLVSNYDAHGKNISFFVGKQGIALAPFYDLVNIALYPGFDSDLAMALGDEFNGLSINAYQFADFAESCNLPRYFVSQRLKKISQQVLTILKSQLTQLASSVQEKKFLQHYQTQLRKQCLYFLEQSELITKIEL